ncbi:hypothetical protein T4A_4765, partial [Trichinella pseudospiralis]
MKTYVLCITKLFESFSILFFVMTDVSGLCLVPNCYRDMCLIYGHRAKRCLKLPSGPANLCPVQDIRDRRILVFAVDSNIRLLAAMQTWDMDGIFKVVPQWYEQLFTIRSFVMGKLVPAVYCLCTGKNIGTFGFIFQALINKAAVFIVNLNPIISDF